jgi:DNA-binding NtrC family response regulator
MQIPTILIVDDEADIREHLKTSLAKKITGTFLTARNAQEALQEIKANSVKMQGLSGIDLIKACAGASAHTKIIVLSAYDSKEIADEALRAGAIDYLTKPCPFPAIESKVAELLRAAKKYTPRQG